MLEKTIRCLWLIESKRFKYYNLLQPNIATYGNNNYTGKRKTKRKLNEIKDYSRETYDDIINKLISIFETLSKEPELKEEILMEIERARRELKEGKGISTKQLLKDLGVKA